MNKFIYRIAKKFDMYSSREQLLLAAVTAIGFYFTWETFLYLPIKKQNDIITQQYKIENDESNKIKAKVQTINKLAASASTQKLIEYHNELKNKLGKLNADISQFKEKYIPANKVNDLINLLLTNTPNVSIKSLNPVEGSNLPSEKVEREVEISNNDQENKIIDQEYNFDRNYELIFHGNFRGFTNYLNTILEIPWDIYWVSLNYEVNNYPNADIKVKFKILVDHSQGIE